MNIAEKTGLEMLRSMLAGRIPPPSMAGTMGFVAKTFDKGFCRFEVTPDDRHLNPMGGVHGGYAAAALDTVTGCAVHTMLAPGFSYATVDLDVKMVKALPTGTILQAEGKILHFSSRIGTAEGALRDAAGTLYAHATSTCIVLPPRSDTTRSSS